MIEHLTDFLMKYSTASLGYFPSAFHKGGLSGGIMIAALIFLSLIALLNLLSWILRYVDQIEYDDFRGLHIYLYGWMKYAIINTTISISVMLLFFNIFGWIGMLAGMSSLFLTYSVTALNSFSDYDEVTGIFGIMDFMKTRADNRLETGKQVAKWKKQYRNLLNEY